MQTMIFYWLDSAGKVQITEDAGLAEKALHEHRQIWGCNKGHIDIGLLKEPTIPGLLLAVIGVNQKTDASTELAELMTETLREADEDLDGLQETATIDDKTVAFGKGGNGPVVVVYHGEEKIFKSNPITMWGAKKEYERILIKILEEPKHYGRREDPSPTECRRCGWRGRVKDTIHTYRPDNMDDVEPVDVCPSCKEELD